MKDLSGQGTAEDVVETQGSLAFCIVVWILIVLCAGCCGLGNMISGSCEEPKCTPPCPSPCGSGGEW